MVDEGLLEIEFKRLNDKTGPGSGRPSKLYKPAVREISASIPARDYELAGGLLAAAIEQSDRTGEKVREALSVVARQAGQLIGTQAGSLDAALDACGYEPHDDQEGGMVLTNCPFHRLSTNHTELICHANVDLLKGIATGAEDSLHTIEFEPSTSGNCCVRVRGIGHTGPGHEPSSGAAP